MLGSVLYRNVLVAVLLLGLASGIWLIFFRNISFKNYLLNGKINQYIQYCDRQIAPLRKSRNNPTYLMWLINVSVGLLYKGDFDEALRILRDMDIRNLPREAIGVYYNNFILCLLYSSNVTEAKFVYDMNVKGSSSKNKSTVYFIARLQAIIECMIGNYAKSAETFDSIPDKGCPKLFYCEKYFHLGKCHLGLGENEKARECFQKALPFAGETIFKASLEKELEGMR